MFLFLFFNLSLRANKAPEVVEKPGDNSLLKLKNLYAQAKELSENEVKYVCSYLSFSYRLPSCLLVIFSCWLIWVKIIRNMSLNLMVLS